MKEWLQMLRETKLASCALRFLRGRTLFLSCLLGVVLLAAGIILMPRYVSHMLDANRLNRVAFKDRDNFSFLEQSSNSLRDNLKAFSDMGGNGSLTLLSTMSESSARLNTNLLGNVYEEAMEAADAGMLYWISETGYDFMESRGYEPDRAPYEDWSKEIRYARYYSLTYDSDEDSNTKEMLNLWYLRFSDSLTFDYYFLVNAVTNQIYYAELYNACADYESRLAKKWLSTETSSHSVGGEVYPGDSYSLEAASEYWNSYWIFEELFSDGCLDYYDASDCRYVEGSSSTSYVSMIVLHFEDGTAYLEKQAMDARTSGDLSGICVSFRDLGEHVRKMIQ